MKALQVKAPGKVEFVDIPVPSPAENEVLIQIKAWSICNQHDLKVYHGKYGEEQSRRMGLTYPVPPGSPGHEASGIIERTGSAVKNLKEGDHVAMTGAGGPGTYQEYVTRDANWVVKIDKKIPFEESAPLELAVCVTNAVRMAEPKDKIVGISGLGPAGLFAVQIAKAMGAKKTIGIDVKKERLEIAKELGADIALNANETEKIKNQDIEVIVECSGNARAVENSFEIARGEVIIFGYTDEEIRVNQVTWFWKELVIRNAAMLGKDGMENFRFAAGLLEQGKLNIRRLISKVMHFDDYEKALGIIESGQVLKIVLIP